MRFTDKKLPEKLRSNAPTKGNQERTDRIIDIIDIIDIMGLIYIMNLIDRSRKAGSIKCPRYVNLYRDKKMLLRERNWSSLQP